MTTPTFAKTHNLIAFLAKPTESEGFEQIIDFLNGSSVRYALTASLAIRTSYIKQSWSTAKVKTVNDKVRVHDLIDAKRVNIKESCIRRTLKLDDEEGTSCLANDGIFTVQKPPPRMNLAALWHQQSSVLPQTRSLTSQAAEEVGQAQDDVSIPTEPSTSKPYKKHKLKKQQPIAPKDSLKLQELMDLCTRLSNKVLDLESEVIDIKSSFTEKIEKLEDKVHKLEEENIILKEKSFKSAKIDINDVIEQVKRSERQNNAVMRNDYSKIRSLFEKHYNSNQALLEKLEEEVTVQENEIEEEGNKRQGESLEQEIAKKQRMDEEAEKLKTHLQIVSNDDDDVYTEATHLASKDGSHKLFLSFITLLKNFNREDLENLYKLVKERFETTEPKNFSDDFLLNIFKIMFKKPNIEANMFLLVEKKYPLTHFTLEKMLNNVRLEVEEESEMSLELLRIVRRQLNKGYVIE
uniref:Uncharacterized protein n=1 Tax=Tanacetum cinerariifolium TaxID=118510 RepID=A0A6L2NCL7_TANCI|nr:hypothetical protein [Tanacetum cinerariifolium]